MLSGSLRLISSTKTLPGSFAVRAVGEESDPDEVMLDMEELMETSTHSIRINFNTVRTGHISARGMAA